MPYYDAPSNDTSRLAFLKRALETATADEARGVNYISAESKTAIQAFIPTFDTAVTGLSQKLSIRSKEARERTDAIEVVKTYTRHLWAVLKLRVQRLKQPAEVLLFYQLPLSGLIPQPSSQDKWLAIAEQVVQGDASAVSAGYPAMVNPTAAELQAVLEVARNEAADIAGADLDYNEAQQTVATLREQADRLIEDVIVELRFHLRRKEAANQRRIMKLYGATFTPLPGEAIEDVEAETGEAEGE